MGTPIRGLQAIYMKVYKCQEEIKEKKAKKNDVSKKEKEALVKSPKNFLEENISEAFKTLEVYQKALETERTRCIKSVKEGMSVDTSTSITRKLRKLYAVTQKIWTCWTALLSNLLWKISQQKVREFTWVELHPRPLLQLNAEQLKRKNL